jgi:hypothetical protein
MIDWKEEVISEYISYQNGLLYVTQKRSEDPILKELKEEKEAIERKLNEAYKPYEVEIADYLLHIEEMKQKLITRWDIKDKTFKCDTGSATIRTTRSLKVDNQELLIGILQHFGKLAQCIKSWDLSYLRKLADADLFEGADVIHYDEKKNVVISGVKTGENVKNEE